MVYYFTELHKLDKEFIKKVMPLLPKDRRNKAKRIKKERDRYLSIVAYVLLFFGLKKEGIILSDTSFQYNEFGKPHFGGIKPVFFNLSHCKLGAACAISRETAGMDIQEILTINTFVLKKVCSNKEIMSIKGSKKPGSEFTVLWTQKESYLKATGKGISEALGEINFGIDKKGNACKDGFLLTSNIYENYVITVCSPERKSQCFIKVSIESMLDFIDMNQRLNQ
ncbi:4'-phosphopantetheinyl transferase family protein [Clostridium sp. WILCCON 0269]|uniref:4'-phosphopantetheinyl transferase family protein n=1 Tax=Candidatus Clostridium eludens TaxID=3381663 RepID=A0ABW8SGE6_9CLOT